MASGGTIALQLAHRGQATLCVRVLERSTLAGADSTDLSPGPGGLGKLPRQLGAARVGLERLDTRPVVALPRPQVERLAARPRGVAVGVDRARLLGGAQERSAGQLRLARAQPVSGELVAPPASGLERLCEAAVQRSALEPGEIGIERLASQRVAEGALAGTHLDDHAELEQLRQSRGAGQSRHEVQIARFARDGGGVGGGACLARELGHADEHGVADALR
jgi:hypothetical protein